MLQNVKALVVVLAIAFIVLSLFAMRIPQFTTKEKFRINSFLWIALTIIAFVSPNIWLYFLVGGFLIILSLRDDNNPVATFLLLAHTIPPLSVEIPGGFVNYIIEANNYRFLIFMIIFPSLIRRFNELRFGGIYFKVSLYSLLSYLILLQFHAFQYESITALSRRSVIFIFDIIILFLAPYFLVKSKEQIREIFYYYIIGVVIMAAVAVFESQRNWLLYVNINYIWGDPNTFAWLLRGDQLRAQASSGHSLALGYMISVAMILFLGIRREIYGVAFNVLIFSILLFGLYSTVSRGPLLVAVVGISLYFILATGAFNMLRAFFIALLIPVVMLLFFKPAVFFDGDYPKFLTSDVSSIEYRVRLLEVSLELIRRHPIFGDPHFLSNMESLRQGQGIIDLVNVYLAVALQSGLFGLLLFILGYVLCIIKLIYSNDFRSRLGPVGDESIRYSLICAMVGTLIMFGVGSFGTSLALCYWISLGLAAKTLDALS